MAEIWGFVGIMILASGILVGLIAITQFFAMMYRMAYKQPQPKKVWEGIGYLLVILVLMFMAFGIILSTGLYFYQSWKHINTKPTYAGLSIVNRTIKTNGQGISYDLTTNSVSFGTGWELTNGEGRDEPRN